RPGHPVLSRVPKSLPPVYALTPPVSSSKTNCSQPFLSPANFGSWQLANVPQPYEVHLSVLGCPFAPIGRPLATDTLASMRKRSAHSWRSVEAIHPSPTQELPFPQLSHVALFAAECSNPPLHPSNSSLGLQEGKGCDDAHQGLLHVP